MGKRGIRPRRRDPRVTTLHAGAVVVAIVSGICALVALAVGSPLQFGIALALFGAGWITADFLQSTELCERGVQRCAVPVARLNRGHESCHVVYLGRGEQFYCSPPRTEHELAA